MIQKIKTTEYLKRYENMTPAELSVYEKRAGEWLEDDGAMLTSLTDNFDSRLQNAVAASALWNDKACRAFEDGALLLSALAQKRDTWLPDLLYRESARSSVRHIVKCLTAFTGSDAENAEPAVPAVKEPTRPANGAAVNDAGAHPEVPAACGPVRPKHIDQYIHLLPVKTQGKAAKVKDLLRELDDARENLLILAEAENAKAGDREAWAKKATSIDSELKSIYKEIDKEWDNLVAQGRVGVDDLGNAYVKPVDQGKTTDTPQELTAEQKARRRELRKFLTDTRRGNGDTREEHLTKWNENYKEYLTLEPEEKALADAKIVAAAEHYGINIKK